MSLITETRVRKVQHHNDREAVEKLYFRDFSCFIKWLIKGMHFFSFPTNVFFQTMNELGKTLPMNRKGRFSSWSTQFMPWLTLCTACTKTSVLGKSASALKWTPSTAHCCSSTSATSTSQVGTPYSISSKSLIQIVQNAEPRNVSGVCVENKPHTHNYRTQMC